MSRNHFTVILFSLGFVLSWSTVVRADSVKPISIVCDSRNGVFQIQYKSPGEVFALYPDDERDQDKDTLVDDVEKYLAGVFAPAFLFDSIEDGGDISWHVKTECGEPFTIWQVTPLTSPGIAVDSGTPMSVIQITYQFLLNEDGGFPDECNSSNVDDHFGDNDFLRMVVGYSNSSFYLLSIDTIRKTDDTPDITLFTSIGEDWYGIHAAIDPSEQTENWTYYQNNWDSWFPVDEGVWLETLNLTEWELDNYYPTIDGENIVINSEYRGWLACHPSVFLSAGKHHKYLQRSPGCFKSPYSTTWEGGGEDDFVWKDHSNGNYSLGPQISSLIIPSESVRAFQGANVGEVHSIKPEGIPYFDKMLNFRMLGDGYLGDQFYGLSETMQSNPVCVFWYFNGVFPAVTKPNARSKMAIAFSPEKGRVYIYGGLDMGQQPQNDLWSFDTVKRAWTLLSRSTGDLPARQGADMVAGLGGNLYLTGGTDVYGPANKPVVWALDTTAAAPRWNVRSIGAPRLLMVGSGTVSETFRSGEPAVFELGLIVPPGRAGRPVQVIDVSDPSAPRWIDTVPTDEAVVDVSAAGGLVVVSLVSGAVELYNVDQYGALGRAGRFQSTGWVEDTLVSGDELHVMSSTGGVEIVDISNRMQPVLKGLDTESSVRVTRRFSADFAVQRALGGGIEAVPVEATDEEE